MPPATDSIVVVAGKQYLKSPSYQNRWGKHYRAEWATPVKVKVVMLDTLAGGLTPYQSGGGRQSKTLRLHDKNKREYVLRSIDKSFKGALPEIYHGTFIEDLINDQVSIAHPYAAITIPPMIEAAGLYHTRPQIVFVPTQPALDSFNNEYGNQLFLFEQRPDENWEIAPNFGNAKNIVGTEKLLEELRQDIDHLVDQKMFVKARLFDMMIGDWGRHEDQWRWAEFREDENKVYRPVPRDRDQVYTKFDGNMLTFVLSAADLDHLQTFDHTIKDVAKYNFPARNLDRRMLNELSRQQWLEAAKELQQSVTDEIIDKAIKKLPAELYSLSGPEISLKIKSRRENLQEYASSYYDFLAEEVEIVGSDKTDLFEITRANDSITRVRLYKIKKDGSIGKTALYTRDFKIGETDEIRIYGLGENDVFNIDGTTSRGIKLRIIGGDGDDFIQDASLVAGAKKLTELFDDESAEIKTSPETRVRRISDTALTNYNYAGFKYDKKGFGLKPGLFSLTLGYDAKIEEWGKNPTGYEHNIKVKYSINRAAVNIEYNGMLYQSLGLWNLGFTVGAGVPTVENFFGVGNESAFPEYNRSFFRFRRDEFYGKLGVNRFFGSLHFVALNGFLHTVKVRTDRGFMKDFNPANGASEERRYYTGAQAGYNYTKTNDPVIPTKGLLFKAQSSYTYNLSDPDHSFTRLSSEAAVYVPLLKFLSFAVRAGGATNYGEADFFQLNRLGSNENLRGFRKERFYGKSSFYNNNELRFIFDVKSKLFNGKAGFVTFYDLGRVWMPNESSNTWHNGYGLELFVAPFNKWILAGGYGLSKEDRVLSAHVGFFF